MKSSILLPFTFVLAALTILVGCGSPQAKEQPPVERAAGVLKSSPLPATPEPVVEDKASEPTPVPQAKESIAPARQDVEREPSRELGRLTARDVKAQINVRVAADPNSTAQHYGLVDDEVYILGQKTGTDGKTWDEIEFVSSGAKGWIRSDFVTSSTGGDRRDGRIEPMKIAEPTAPERTESVPNFANCREARAAGYTNFATTPGGKYDRDGDGIGCEG